MVCKVRCCSIIKVCDDEANSFSISQPGAMPIDVSGVDVSCNEDFIVIEGIYFTMDFKLTTILSCFNFDDNTYVQNSYSIYNQDRQHHVDN